MTYEEAIQYISSRPRFSPGSVEPGKDPFNLESITLLMERLQNPQDSLRFVHVAGTNGKGSFAAFLSRILMESGLKTGIYTSPFLERFTERIRIGDREIGEEDLAELVEKVRDAVRDMEKAGEKLPTEFEVVCAAAFLWFAKEKCDVVVLEVGLGGRLDATNVIRCPDLHVITTISYDHMEVLGHTLAEIAGEKAGIIKPGGTVLTFPAEPEVEQVFLRVCGERGARLLELKEIPKALSSDLTGQSFDLEPGFLLERTVDGKAREAPGESAESRDRKGFSPETETDPGRLPPETETGLRDLRIRLLGSYQTGNAALALSAALLLRDRGYPITEESIRKGLWKASWPGRFELLKREPYVLIDGSHNAEGARALGQSLDLYFPGKKVIFIAGVLSDKEYGEMISCVLPKAKHFYCVAPPSPRALAAGDLAAFINEMAADPLIGGTGSDSGPPAEECSSVEEALSLALREAGREDVILAFGSLYYIGLVRALLRDKGDF